MGDTSNFSIWALSLTLLYGIMNRFQIPSDLPSHIKFRTVSGNCEPHSLSLGKRHPTLCSCVVMSMIFTNLDLRGEAAATAAAAAVLDCAAVEFGVANRHNEASWESCWPATAGVAPVHRDNDPPDLSTDVDRTALLDLELETAITLYYISEQFCTKILYYIFTVLHSKTRLIRGTNS